MFSPWIQLDSSLSGSSWPVAGFRPREVLRCDSLGRGASLTRDGSTAKVFTDELDALAWMECESGGSTWVGYLSYDLGRAFESLPSRNVDDLELPMFVFARAPRVADSHRPLAAPPAPPLLRARCNFSREEYLAAVGRAINYIAAGDIFQVNLSQRFTAPLGEDPWWIYSRLLTQSPATFGGFLDFGDHALVCNSPELFLDVAGLPDGSRRVVTRPIKGTRPNLPGLREQLLASVKDQAELNMIIDLERNDLGRVCQTGSVRVSQPRVVEEHPTVLHGVATVEGILRRGTSFLDLLRATFPGGSITGAPKIRAMQIIDELEPTRRGPYCGAIGSLGPGGRILLNMAIRTMLIKGGQAHIPVGGGVVADSTPEHEYAETLTKARAMFAALGIRAPD